MVKNMANKSGMNKRMTRSPKNDATDRLRNENRTPTPEIKNSKGSRH